MRGELEEVLARHTGKDLATLRIDTDRDLILTAAEGGRVRRRRPRDRGAGCSGGQSREHELRAAQGAGSRS